jgi:hypothetical protein
MRIGVGRVDETGSCTAASSRKSPLIALHRDRKLRSRTNPIWPFAKSPESST